MRTLIPFLILVSIPALAAKRDWIDRDEVNICPQRLTSPDQIVCCDTLPNKTCDQTLNETLTPKQISFLRALTAELMVRPTQPHVLPTFPSCFGTAVAIAGDPVDDPFQFSDERELKKNLAISYEEIYDTRNLRHGDIIVFDEQGEYLWTDDDEMGRKSFRWGPGRLSAHAMYYLGNGLVIQKENANTAVTSVSTIERAMQVVSAGIEETQHQRTQDYAWKKTKIVLRAFRHTLH